MFSLFLTTFVKLCPNVYSMQFERNVGLSLIPTHALLAIFLLLISSWILCWKIYKLVLKGQFMNYIYLHSL